MLLPNLGRNHFKKKGEIRMSQCLRITFVVENGLKQSLSEAIQKEAKKLQLEGVIQAVQSDKLSVVACGLSDQIEDFLDLVYKQLALKKCDDLEIEPLLKDKDYRGVFRIIE